MSASINELLMQPSPLGELFTSARGVTGPASYTTGGVTISANFFALLTIRWLVSSMTSADGLYFLRFKIPLGPGFPTATVIWCSMATGLEVGNGTNLSAETVKVQAYGN